MGYIVHHAIVVTTYKDRMARHAHAEAELLGLVVSAIAPSPLNGYSSFCIFPDGSKEGWPESDEGDSQRSRWIEWAKSQAFEDGSSALSWVEVQYGECDAGAEVTNHYKQGD